MEKVEFTPEQLRELQLKELETLVYFKEFCDEHNLLFYLVVKIVTAGKDKKIICIFA